MKTNRLFILALLLVTLSAYGQNRNAYPQRNVTDLGFGYSKDHRHVYYHGKILPYVDPATFRVSPLFGPDETSLDRSRIDEELELYDGSYHVTTFDVFFNGKKIKGASSNSFQVLGGGYAKDAFDVYYLGKRIKGASANSFRYIGRGYAEDAFDTYFRGAVIKDNLP